MKTDELTAIEREERASRFLSLIQESKKGKLKIYLGMAPGVGKTYRMLAEAKELLSKGFDVRIAFIETHNRAETLKMTEGLPVIERKKVFYKGKYLEEMDTETVLLLKPDIVLADELPHSNIPGSVREKRWQDVFAMLDAGINVITALNIQHLESLNSEAEAITGVPVTERVPDFVLQRANELVNVDLTASDLIDRLESGKIYDLGKVRQALVHFFQPDKLLQLRELALKEVAHRLESQIEARRLPSENRVSLQYTSLLSCISSNEKSGKEIIRKSARLAAYYGLKWQVMYVETPREHPDRIALSLQRGLINNFKLATDLGGEVVRRKHRDPGKALIEYITECEINLAVLGKSLRPKWMLWKTSPIERILNHPHAIDLIILS